MQVVCGAPNARPGLVAPLATIGTRVGELTIKAAKLRGVESNGMILAEDELAIGPDHDGIMVLDPELAVGTPLADVLPIATDVLELAQRQPGVAVVGEPEERDPHPNCSRNRRSLS